MMKIVKATDAIPVEHPVFLLFGQPGICKSSLGYSMPDVLTLDFDKGAHRAANRKDTLIIDSWADVTALMHAGQALDPYRSVVVDTVGRCLDVMTAEIARESPKLAPNGNLSQQGWGTLKTRFRTWIASLRALGKDVLLIAHDKEDKDGDVRVVRPEIVGGSYGEVMKIADFVGYVYMNGRERVLDFNPTDRWIGKNPAGWAPFPIPPIGKAQAFMADLYAQGREALGKISEASAIATQQVDDWRAQIDTFTTADEFNRAVTEIKQLAPVVLPQVAKLLLEAAERKGIPFDKVTKRFLAPATPEPEPVGSLL